MESTSINNKLSRLDRTISVLIENPDQTASREFGISPTTERIHRLHGTSIILQSSRGLGLGASSFATACIIFHRFLHSVSLTKHDVWSVALCCTLLSAKLEEEPKSLKQIIEEYNKIYARRLSLVDHVNNHDNENDYESESALIRSSNYSAVIPLLEKQRRDICENHLPQHLNKFGPVFKEWHAQISKMESIILRQLGFTFYWISDSLPQKFIFHFCKALELKDKKVTARAWNYCNDSFRLDLSIRYRPEVIAAGVILLATRDLNIMLPTKPRPWWEVFIGSDKTTANELVDVANTLSVLCNLCDQRKDADSIGSQHVLQCDDDKIVYIDWLVASKGYVRSLVNVEDNGISFLDPDSFLWLYQKETFEKIINNND